MKTIRIIGAIIETIAFVAGMALLLWMFISWFDVILHNMKSNPQYLEWNFFKVLVGWAR